jgi:hypothetical protein
MEPKSSWSSRIFKSTSGARKNWKENKLKKRTPAASGANSLQRCWWLKMTWAEIINAKIGFDTTPKVNYKNRFLYFFEKCLSSNFFGKKIILFHLLKVRNIFGKHKSSN